MSESDVLQRAAASLRAAHDGQREGSGFTRARILGTLAQRRRPRRWRWLVAAPFATLLLVGSAWAQSTGSWARVWQAVATVLPFIQPSSPPPRSNTAKRDNPPRSRAEPAETLPAAPAPVEPAPQAAPAPVTEPPATEPPVTELAPAAPGPPLHQPPTTTRAKTTARAARATAARPPPELPADPELSTFRTAHELHVQSQPRAAIDAYAAYLRAYPHGRFVPEARYNTALDWIKLGDTQAARKALEPFAEGAYDGYRQREAQQLLEALPR
jgi:TolA-binding protein